METNSESQRMCQRCCDETACSTIDISTRGSMTLWCCFSRLLASLSTWRDARLACQRRAQRPRLTPPPLPPRPSRRNNGIGPEGATSLAGPLATLTKLQWLELGYGPLAACEGVVLGGREAWRRGNADWLCAREGGETHCSATSTLSSAARRVRRRPPLPPVHVVAGTWARPRAATDGGSDGALHSPLARPRPLDSRRPSPPQVERPRPRRRVGPGGVARAAGRPVVPEPQRRRALQGEQVLF
jgi:hypothetical protein